jgi:hypothetical protein
MLSLHLNARRPARDRSLRRAAVVGPLLVGLLAVAAGPAALADDPMDPFEDRVGSVVRNDEDTLY